MTTGTDKDGHAENIADGKLRQLQQDLLKAQSDRVATQSKYELISSAPIDSLPQVVDDTNLHEYQNKMAELRRQYAEFSVALTPEHRKVAKIQGQIDELRDA